MVKDTKKILEPTYLIVLMFSILGAIGIGLAVWRLTNPEPPFKTSIEDVQLNESWLNFTICFTELPKNDTQIYSLTIGNGTQNLNIKVSNGDRLTVRSPLATPVEYPENMYCYLHTEYGDFKIQITEQNN